MKKFLTKLLIACLFTTSCLSIKSIVIKADTTYQMISPGMSQETATVIPCDGKDYVGTVTEEVENHYYQFTVPQNATGFYTVYAKNLSIDGSIGVQIYNSFGETIEELDYIHKNNDDYINQKLIEGCTYYIRVGGYYDTGTGNYKLNLSYREDKESDIMAGAKTIAANKSYQYTCDGAKDNDFFKFVPTTTGNYEVYGKNLSMTDWCRLYVYSASEEELYSSDYLYKNKIANTSLKLIKGETYYIKIEGNYGIGKYKFYVKQINPSKVVGLKVVRNSPRGFKAAWSKASGCNGYEVQYSNSKKFKTYESRITSSNSYTSRYLPAKMTYVRVRAYKQIDGVKYYGSFSAVKQLQIK